MTRSSPSPSPSPSQLESQSPEPKAIFAHALDHHTPVARARYLAEACGDDSELRGEVDSMLWAYEAEGNLQETPALPVMSVDDMPAIEGPGSVIGPYQLQEVIGEGGMGVVYEAEQTYPIRRKVALKIIRPEIDSRQVMARFEAERQALALMDHPNIAKVLDAGATAAGRPYFVMELVKGPSITEYCDQFRLTPRERMELMVPVCQAIQHAHQKGIIHRDIKPSNVIVSLYDGAPVPKVIDFGVAKAVDQRLTDRTLLTQDGMIVGTLEYMSPEQAENSALDVDTRSDVYSLGVLVYELLTGTTPLGRLKPKQVGYSETLRRIREEEPPSPSSRIASAEKIESIAARCGTEPAKLTRIVRGELDWIALKALEKDRVLRYSTANDLARDLQRYLNGGTVEAGPPSATYRVRKFVRKYRTLVTFAGAFVVVLIAAALISFVQAARASREAAKARVAEAKANAMLGFFRDRVLAAAGTRDQKGGLGRATTLRDALDAAEPRIATEFAGQPDAEAEVRDTLGTTYSSLGESALAIRQYERALALREASLGSDHPLTLRVINNLASAYRDAGRFVEAIPLQERNLDIVRSRFGPEHPLTILNMSNLASSYRLAGRIDKSIALFEKVLALRESKLGPTHPDTIKSVNQLAVAYQAAGRTDKAIPMHQRDLAFSTEKLGRNHPDTLFAMSNLAAAYQVTGRLEEAFALLKETIALRTEVLGRDHPDTLTSMNNLAAAYQTAGRSEEAVAASQEVFTLRKAKLGFDHPDTIRSMSNLALAYRSAGRSEESLRTYEEVFKLRKVKLGPEHPDTIKTMGNLGEAYVSAKRWSDAEGLLRECLRLLDVVKPGDWQRFHAMSLLGAAMAGQGKYAEAERMLIDGYEGLVSLQSKIPAPRLGDLKAAFERIAPFYETWGKPEIAASWRSKQAPSPVGPGSKP